MFNSQVKQDVFVNKVLNKDYGFFLDIGAGFGGMLSDNPGFYSNTYFFEYHRKCSGIAIDFDENWFNTVNNNRRCKCLCVDLLESNINEVLESNDCPREIDYISFDLDDAQHAVFNQFDWDKYKFNVLTLEHNIFQSMADGGSGQIHDDEHKSKIIKEYEHFRRVLNNLGYKLLWSDVTLSPYGPLEDWWVSNSVYEKHSNLIRHSPNCNMTSVWETVQ